MSNKSKAKAKADSEFFQNEYREIGVRHKIMEIKAKPYLERFHAFMLELGVTWSYMPSFPMFPGEPKDYYLVTGSTDQTGLMFGRSSYEGELAIVVPWEYIEDPESWEKLFKDWFVGDREMAQRLVSIAHPGVKVEEVTLSYESNDLLIVNLKDPSYKLKTRIVMMRRSTKELFDTMYAYRIIDGSLEPIAKLD